MPSYLFYLEVQDSYYRLTGQGLRTLPGLWTLAPYALCLQSPDSLFAFAFQHLSSQLILCPCLRRVALATGH